MSHKRSDIRDAVVSILVAGSTAAGTKVYAEREAPKSNSALPLILVYARGEDSGQEFMSGTRYIRTLDLQIEAKAEGSTGVQTALDNLCLEIETLISANRSLNGTATGAIYAGTELTFDWTGEKPIGVAVLSYKIQYIL
jgi:hypothetical protein